MQKFAINFGIIKLLMHFISKYSKQVNIQNKDIKPENTTLLIDFDFYDS